MNGQGLIVPARHRQLVVRKPVGRWKCGSKSTSSDDPVMFGDTGVTQSRRHHSARDSYAHECGANVDASGVEGFTTWPAVCSH